jgi:hypothetical protein
LDGKYRVVKSPIELAECKIDDVRTFLGRSENGVYFAAIAEKGLAIYFEFGLSTNPVAIWSGCQSIKATSR